MVALAESRKSIPLLPVRFDVVALLVTFVDLQIILLALTVKVPDLIIVAPLIVVAPVIVVAPLIDTAVGVTLLIVTALIVRAGADVIELLI